MKDYLLHLRPAEWPTLALHFLMGAALAIGASGLFRSEHRNDLLLGTLAFVVGINGGTLALNSAFDRDQGAIAYLEHPPPAPRGLAAMGVSLMVLALAVAFFLPTPFRFACTGCAVLSFLYSVPPVRLKAVAGLDWVVNFLGFGWLTPYAGWALTGQPVTPSGALILASFTLLFGALYPLTQLYHLADDTARGDRTLAVRLGITRTFGLAMPLAALALAGFALAGGLSRWAEPTSRWLALGLAAFGWVGALWPWWKNRLEVDSRGHQRFMKRCFLAWAATDLAVLWAFAR